jgi:hypothetical protein
MNEDRDRSQLTRFAVRGVALLVGMLFVGMMAVLVIATEPASFQAASSDPPAAGVSGLARPHQPLDRAPSEPLETPVLDEGITRHAGSFVSQP